MLKEKAPQQHCIGRLLVRPKRRRPKTAPRALESVIYEINDSDDSDSDSIDPICPVRIWPIMLLCARLLLDLLQLDYDDKDGESRIAVETHR